LLDELHVLPLQLLVVQCPADEQASPALLRLQVVPLQSAFEQSAATAHCPPGADLLQRLLPVLQLLVVHWPFELHHSS
jgi:hypothetical protein